MDKQEMIEFYTKLNELQDYYNCNLRSDYIVDHYENVVGEIVRDYDKGCEKLYYRNIDDYGNRIGDDEFLAYRNN